MRIKLQSSAEGTCVKAKLGGSDYDPTWRVHKLQALSTKCIEASYKDQIMIRPRVYTTLEHQAQSA